MLSNLSLADRLLLKLSNKATRLSSDLHTKKLFLGHILMHLSHSQSGKGRQLIGSLNISTGKHVSVTGVWSFTMASICQCLPSKGHEPPA